MKQFKISLKTIQDVRDFVNKVTLCEYEVDLASGRYTVDAKSIMGIFSLDLLQPIEMTVYSDDCEKFIASIEKYIIK